MSKLIYKECGYLAKAAWPNLALDKTEIRGLRLDYETRARELSPCGIFCIIEPHKILSISLTIEGIKKLSIWITIDDISCL